MIAHCNRTAGRSIRAHIPANSRLLDTVTWHPDVFSGLKYWTEADSASVVRMKAVLHRRHQGFVGPTIEKISVEGGAIAVSIGKYEVAAIGTDDLVRPVRH